MTDRDAQTQIQATTVQATAQIQSYAHMVGSLACPGIAGDRHGGVVVRNPPNDR